MRATFYLTLCLGVVSLAAADVVAWRHDISVRIALKSRLKDYRQEFPWPLAQPFPEYPAKWKEEGVTGEALLRITVSSTGKVTDVRVLKFSQKEFADAAAIVAQQWKFRPGLDSDRKTPISFELEYLFRFERHEE